ncbi:MAG: DNA-processing protein DprA [Desulfuromonadales bacterium]|nr:DNA-processing protein DprA [Desulfuromonadales bacterium]MDT8423176.1 DNA-processing protein DprA [Desulfuromonadales bacterium]
MTETEQHWLRLHLTPGLGRTGLLRLVSTFGSPAAACSASPADWISRAGTRPDVAHNRPSAAFFATTCDRLNQLSVRIISIFDPAYPQQLAAIHDPPTLLYVRGQLPAQDAFAVVGSRQPLAGNRQWATALCAELAAHDITIVSGLARGIDSAAHTGALEGKGQTIAVLGCGIDRIYPRENARLFERIPEQGAIISEYPPDAPPVAGHFPGRNRIISGLSKGVLVVEAAAKSGSLITVDFALEQGREVFAAPGAVYASGSIGVNRLLKEGAHPVIEARDILEHLWPATPPREIVQKHQSFAETLTGAALKTYLALGPEPLHGDDLVRKTGLTPIELSAILLHLELQGGITQLPGTRYIRADF